MQHYRRSVASEGIRRSHSQKIVHFQHFLSLSHCLPQFKLLHNVFPDHLLGVDLGVPRRRVFFEADVLSVH